MFESEIMLSLQDDKCNAIALVESLLEEHKATTSDESDA